MKHKIILAVIFSIVFAFGLAIAQHDHSDNSEDSSHSHEDHHADDSSHDHSDHGDDHSDHHDHSDHMMEAMADAQNSFMIAGQDIMIDPIVLADGSFQLGVRLISMMDSSMEVDKADSDQAHSHGEENHSDEGHHEEGHSEEEHHGDDHSEDAHSDHGDEMTHSDEMSGGMTMMMPALSIITPGGESVSPMMVHGDLMEVMTFPVGMIEAGIYRVTIMMGDDMLELPVGVYTTDSSMIDAYLVLAPNPSLSSRGQSQTFLYSFREGEPIHSGTMLQRSMAGMQHMTDDEELPFTHTHFFDLYDDAVGETPMSNEMALSFAMAGTWDVNVMIMGDMAETLNFNVEVLNE